MGKSTISMVMFNSYVKLPEGYPVSFGPTQKPIPGARFRHLHRLHQRPATLGPQPRTEAVLRWNGAGGGIHGVGTCRWGSWGNSPRKNPGFIDIKMRSLHDLNNKKQTMKSWWLILLFGSYWGSWLGIYILKGSAPCRRPLGISSVAREPQSLTFWTTFASSLSCLSSSREGSQTAPSPHRNSRALRDGPGLRATAPSS